MVLVFFFVSLMLQASDPDVGEGAQLVYSLAANGSHFGVEPSSGLVYVVSLTDLSEELVQLEVRATDPRGLQASTRVEVSVAQAGGGNPVSPASLHPELCSASRWRCSRT